MNTKEKKNSKCRKRQLIRAAILAVGILLFLLLGGSISAASAGQKKTEVYYTSVQVEAGDSLWSLAQKYAPQYSDINEYVNTLRQVNRICREDRLLPGQILIVPYYK